MPAEQRTSCTLLFERTSCTLLFEICRNNETTKRRLRRRLEDDIKLIFTGTRSEVVDLKLKAEGRVL
jgi:hypothetical protein